MIYFKKIAPYTLKPKDTDVYQYLSDLTMQRIDPPSNKTGYIDVPTKILVHSTLNRAVDSIPKLQNFEALPRKALNEVLFDMNAVCGRELWEKEGSVAVRQGFIRSFIADTLPITRDEIFGEIRGALRDIRTALEQHESVTVLSHSFKMKLIEAHIKTKGRIEREPNLIHDYLSKDEKTYEFLRGFEVPNDALGYIQ